MRLLKQLRKTLTGLADGLRIAVLGPFLFALLFWK
jgi:hypothetical protein